MPHIRSTVRVEDIPAIASDPKRGIVSLVGDHGGLSLITGDITKSGVILGALALETEHGTVYLDPDSEVEISEEYPLDNNIESTRRTIANFERHRGLLTDAEWADALANQLRTLLGSQPTPTDLAILKAGRISEGLPSTISKTTLTFEVLHRTDEPIGELEEALSRSFDGHAVGLVTAVTTTEVSDDAVPSELVRLGNDGEFFEEDLREHNLEQPLGDINEVD